MVSIPVVVDEPSGEAPESSMTRALQLSQSLLSWMSPRADRRAVHHIALPSVSIPVVVDEPSGAIILPRSGTPT